MSYYEHVYEVLVEHEASGWLSRPHYPGTGDPAVEFVSRDAAERWIATRWKSSYRRYNTTRRPVVVRR